MSIKPWEKYQPNAQIPTPQYPWGSLKNESNLGVGDGTPLDVDWGNDFEAFKQTAFDRSGLNPSGVPDTVENSEMFNAMQDITVRNIWQRVVAESGYTLSAGSFEEGATLNSNTEYLWYKTENKVYNWKGAYPKVIPTASSPASTGGVSSSGWLPLGDITLREELAAADGASKVGGALYADIRAYAGAATRIDCLGRVNMFDGAHGVFAVDPSDTTSPDDGGTILVDATGKRWKRQYSGAVNVTWFGADPTSTVDSLPAFNAARNSISALGGDLYAPAGMYKLSGKFELTSGVSIGGDGCFKGTDALREGVTVLFCEHTGAAMLSLKGANGCYVRNISLQGSSVAKPKTGLMLGRSSSASAGHHHIENVTVIGYFTVAGIYNIASEENSFTNVWSWNFGGNADYGLIISTQDIFNVDGMTSSTCLFNNFYNLRLYNTSPSVSAAGILLACAEEMGSINFFGTYLIQYAGAYIRISQGSLDGKRALGPFNFYGVAGEIYSGGAPKLGVDLVSSVPLNWQGLNIDNPRFQLPANTGGDIYDIRQDINTTLLNPKIIISPPESFPYPASAVRRDKIVGGVVAVSRSGDWVPLTLGPGFISPLGSPYAQPAYRISNDGAVELRGVVQGSSGPVITTLPFSANGGDLIFPTIGSAGIARVKLSKVDGNLSIVSGSAASGLDLTPIRFSIR